MISIRLGGALLAAAGLWPQTGAPPPGRPVSPAAPAEDLSEMQTDRPGLGTPPDVLPAGVLQLEAGLGFNSERDHGRKDRTVLIGNPLLRLGIGRRLELRFGGDGFLTRSSTAGSLVERGNGLSDSSLGAKIKLLEERGPRPAVSIIPSLSLPLGSAGFSSSGFDPSMTVAWAHSLPRGFNVGGSLDFFSQAGDGGREWQRAVSLALGYRLAGGRTAFCEVYGGGPGGSGGGARLFSTGVTQAVGRNAQIDVGVGRDLRPSTPAWFLGVGLVLRSTGFSRFFAPVAGRGIRRP